MKFSVNARLVAEDRQDKNDGWGPWCARCCENFGFAETFAIPRIPFAKGVLGRLTIVLFCATSATSKLEKTILK